MESNREEREQGEQGLGSSELEHALGVWRAEATLNLAKLFEVILVIDSKGSNITAIARWTKP